MVISPTSVKVKIAGASHVPCTAYVAKFLGRVILYLLSLLKSKSSYPGCTDFCCECKVAFCTTVVLKECKQWICAGKVQLM
jgi:hypothetical protein